MAVELPPLGLTPQFRLWEAGRPIIRAHPSTFGSTEFDRRPDADSRWSSIAPDGRVQGVLYGAADHHAAASETIFHTVPDPDRPDADMLPRQVPLGPYQAWVWSVLACERALRLVDLGDSGLSAIGATRQELILSGRRDYPTTRRWSEALWHVAPEADGLYWDSRQAPGRVALMLFEARDDRPGGVARSELFADGPPDPFFYPDGLERLSVLAAELDITLVF